MANKTYRAEITPLGNYYFGSENTFQSTDKAEDDKLSVNYLVRSRMYPQQSALLGLMRYIVLLKQKALYQTADTKAKLIGAKSFSGNEKEAPIQWGRIISVSPLFILRAGKKYLVSGQDVQFYDIENKTIKTKLTNVCKQDAKSSLGEKDFFFFENYDPKQYAQINWKNSESDNDILTPKDIFSEFFQVGITKSFNGETDNDAFYKQYFYKLNKGFSFAVYILLNEEIENYQQPVIAPFGADQSLFSIKFTEEDNSLFPEPERIEDEAKITLLSDAYCDPSVLDHCFISITNAIDFRYIKTNVATKRYYNLSKHEGDMQKSAKLNLLERGSVLYTEKAGIIQDELHKHIAYRNAGFNFYTIQPLT